MKILTIPQCQDCPYFHSVDNIICDLQTDENEDRIQIQYDEKSFDEAVEQLYNLCPLLDLNDILYIPNQVLWERLYNQ